jgi:hypothetical protein
MRSLKLPLTQKRMQQAQTLRSNGIDAAALKGGGFFIWGRYN